MIAHAATQWFNAALGLLYPESCQLCGAAAGPAQGYVCQACHDSVRFIERPFCERCGRPFEGDITTKFECAACLESQWHFLSARSAVVAKDKARMAILDYKYKRALWFEPFLAGLLIERAAPELAKAHWDLIVPVPLHPTKFREREFNQAERLARRLSGAVQLPVNRRLLRRVVPTSTQTRLPRKERLENVRNAFAMRPRARLDGERIVLVDDVFTTGATTSACARVLKAAGAAEVCVWTVARGI
jgi:ComF family protein